MSTPAPSPVRQVHKDLDPLEDDLVRLVAIDVGDESDTASVVLVARVV